MFGGSIYSREHYITAIQDHDGRIIDASLGGVKDTISGQVVFADAKVQSLSSHGQYMFALIDTGNYGYYFEGIASRRGFNYCGSVLEYKCGNSIISQAICVPYVSRIGGKEIPFSIVSCAYHDILDINGETVKGTVMNKSDICRLALLGCKDNIADVAYGATLGAIYVARLDLKDKTLVDKSILVSDTGDSVLSLFAVHNEKMHEKLVRMGKIKRVEDLLIGDEKE